MITKVEFMEGIRILQNNYHKNLTGSQLKLFYENLKDMSKNQFISNINKHINQSDYMPNIAQIKYANKREISNYEQRDYTNVDINKFYAN